MEDYSGQIQDYSGQIQALESKILKLKEKRKEQKKLIKSTNKKDFNPKESFKSGDIVVFSGFDLMIAKIQKEHSINDDNGYMITKNMHFSHCRCRLATPEEIEFLGDKQFIEI